MRAVEVAYDNAMTVKCRGKWLETDSGQGTQPWQALRFRSECDRKPLINFEVWKVV